MAQRLLGGYPLEVREGPHGRFCVTTQPVAAGSLLLTAVPFAVALEPEHVEFVCFGCAKVTQTPLPLRCEVRTALSRLHTEQLMRCALCRSARAPASAVPSAVSASVGSATALCVAGRRRSWRRCVS